MSTEPTSDKVVPQIAKSPPSVEGSVKDTIESILVAFMLAFIFRAFVVEAFVIPTGSMAPTLLGAHMRFRCPDCGYRFDVNYQGTETGSDDVHIPTSAGVNRYYAIFCPNCGYRLPRENSEDPANDARDPAVRYGDRILVLKYLYLLQEPRRWDVVVFKSPHDPDQFDYSQNYIKRLVGRPGESIMILDGDIFVGKGTDLDSFTVQTKPPKVQNALWRIVYDTDYHPRGLNRRDRVDRNGKLFHDEPFEQPWKPAPDQSRWIAGDGAPGNRGFAFNNLTGTGTLTFDPAANPRKNALTDWLAYDVTDNQSSRDESDTFRTGGYAPDSAVSDVKLEFVYQRRDGDGPLSIELTKLGHRFQVQLTPGQAVLLMDGRPLLGPAPIPHSSQPLQVEMSNVDYRVSLKINGEEVLATSPEHYRPNVRALVDDADASRRYAKPQISIIGSNQSCVVQHLQLWRDVYYLNRNPRNREPLRWASPHSFPEHLMQLGDDEFFVVGDNSYVSLDARYWDENIRLPHEGLNVLAGRVPRRFMLGKAFFVYWPAGYRPIKSAPALAPNFGDMRFIH